MTELEKIESFVKAVNRGIDRSPILKWINYGGCGWYSYYMQREILKRFKPRGIYFVYLERFGWGDNYKENILNNADTSLPQWARGRKSSCAHVITRVSTSTGSIWFDSCGVYYDDLDMLSSPIADGEMCIGDEFALPPAIYRKGALTGKARENWNERYPVSRGNKALRECIAEA